MKSFKNIAKLVRESREASGLSQAHVAKVLGYKNPQYISNCERGLCGIPSKKIDLLSKILKMHNGKSRIVEAMQADFKETIYAETGLRDYELTI